MMANATAVRSARGLAAASALVLAVWVSPVAVSAAATGPFDGLQGVWTGDGTLTYASGTQERLTCKAQYSQANTNSLTQALVCASDSYKFQINASFASANGKLSGNWAELTNNVSGSLTGTVGGGKINGSLAGPGFTATLAVVTTGTKQTVNINAMIQQIRAVSIQMQKSP